LIELMIGLTLGTVILSAAITFLITHMRALEGSDIRENVARNDRYIGALLRRDVQMAGIDLESSTLYGSVSVWPGSTGDTLILLYVPYDPNAAPIHEVDPMESQPIPGRGTCGERCLEILYDPGEPQELGIGDLARIEVFGVRRLILLNDFNFAGGVWEITWTSADTLLHQPAGLTGGLQVAVPGTLVQKVAPIIYYLDDQQRLMRAERLKMNGSPDGHVVAFGVQQFDISLIFADGDTLPKADPFDSDNSNDFDDVVGVKVTVTVRANRTDVRVNDGELVTKTSEWRISPRNLRYEKNR
jgi:hypothetical protein